MNAAVEVPEETAAAVDAATANSTVGPESAEACSTHVASHAGAAFFCRELQSRLPNGSDEPLRLLVAGCGAGHEAAYIRMSFHCTVDAVDIERARGNAGKAEMIAARVRGFNPQDDNEADALALLAWAVTMDDVA